MRTHFVFSLIYATYIDVGRSRGSNQVGKLFKHTHKYIINSLEQSPINGAKKRICFWYVFTSPSSRGGPVGCIWTQMDQKIGLLCSNTCT